MLGLGIGSLLLVTSVAVSVASIVVKLYSSAPAGLLVTLWLLTDFTWNFLGTLFNIAYIVATFLSTVVYQVLGPISWMFYLVYWAISLYLWITWCLIRGLLGLDSQSWNSLSWVVCICYVIVHIDLTPRQQERLREMLTVRFFILWLTGRANEHRDLAVVAARIEQEEEAEVAAAQLHQENQLLEIENRENENEENALEEADRNRVNIDNVQNDQRELDRDREQQRDRAERDRADQRERADQPPARQRRVVELDSSDDEIDPNMCSVCLNRVRGSALFPCGHTYLCRVCARIIVAAERPCPICQTPIEEVRNVYL